MIDKSREHVVENLGMPGMPVVDAIDPNTAQVGKGAPSTGAVHSSSVVSVQFLPVFISQEYPVNWANPKLLKQHPRFVLGVHLPLYNK